MRVYQTFLLPVSLCLALSTSLIVFFFRTEGRDVKWVEGVIHTVSLSLSRAHHLESITPRRLWLEFEWSMWRSHTVSLLPPTPHPSIRPSLSLLHAVPLSPSTLANRGNYALNWHPVYTLNRHQLQLCDTRTNTSMLSLPLHFPRSLSVTHPVNGKEGCFSLTSSGGMSGWRCLWRRNTWVTGGYGAGL